MGPLWDILIPMKVKELMSERVILVLRRLFYNTPVMHWKITPYLYDKVFSIGAPDLSKPIHFRGAKFFVDPVDRSYVPTMVAGYYEKHELDVFTEISKLAKLFLDIGANIGMYSVIAATENAKVDCYAFEPVRENQVLLKKNIELNNVEPRVRIVKSAVSNKTGTANISLSDKLSGTHSLSVDRGGGTRKVPTVTVDEFCDKHKLTPDLIKMDVEGHEASVFSGMIKTQKRKPTIFMEYIPGLNKDMKNHLGSLSKIYGHCFVIDDIKGRVEKMKLDEINPKKSYNIVLASNKTHVSSIMTFVSGTPQVKEN